MPRKKETLLTTHQAATVLSVDLGLNETVWLYRLQNWRKPGRKTIPLAHTTTDDGAPAYQASAIQAFVNSQLAVRDEVLRIEGGPAVRCRPAALPMFDGTDRPHVRVTFATGSVTQSVFSIDARTARLLASALVSAAEKVDKFAPVATEFDNDDVDLGTAA